MKTKRIITLKLTKKKNKITEREIYDLRDTPYPKKSNINTQHKNTPKVIKGTWCHNKSEIYIPKINIQKEKPNTNRNLKNKKPYCYNCKFAGKAFKVFKMTHHHCEDERQYNQEKFDNDEFGAWDTLRIFYDTCNNHKFKN